MAALDVDSVLSRLSIEEKIDLLSGADFRHTNAIPRLDIPALKVSNGPNGVTGERMFDGTPAACLPCGTALGATWDTELLLEAGRLFSREAKAKAAHIILGPCVNMQRAPIGGRGFESYSEDPVLSGNAAAAVISGMQEGGVMACIKHFVANDQEHDRGVANCILTERALREIYLLPFQIAIRDSSPGTVMASYNRLNGTHVSENSRMLDDILRKEWRWNGVVISDWFGTYSTTESVNSGLTLEMPGPTRWRGKLLSHAITHGKVDSATLDARAREMLELINKCSRANISREAVEGGVDTPETARLLRKLAADSIVLLKNEKSLLPLKPTEKIAIIGSHVKTATYCGGGSSSLVPYYTTSPFDGFSKKLASEHLCQYAVGAYAHKELPFFGREVRTPDGRPGVLFSLYTEPPEVATRKAVDVLNPTNTNMFLLGFRHPKLTDPLWWAAVEFNLKPDSDVEYDFGLSVYGTGKLFVNDELVVDNATTQKPGGSFFGLGTAEIIGSKLLRGGQEYSIRVEYASAPTSKLLAGGKVQFPGGGIRIGGAPKIDARQEIIKAVEIAKTAEKVVLCIGLNSDWESEGHDRAHMRLPGHIDELVTEVTAANRNTIVVIQSGTPVEMPWAKQAGAIVQAWYGGNEAGNAIADILYGDVNPSGKLPLSFPYRLQDNPAFLNSRSEGGRILYGEDIYIGYRYYDSIGLPVLFPFGFGLSYTTFELSAAAATVDTGAGQLVVTLNVQNTGPRAGAEVVQIYVSQAAPSVRRPTKELKAYKKLFLKPGEKEAVSISVSKKYATSFWDEKRNAWVSQKDTYTVQIEDGSGTGAALRATFEIGETTWWKGL